MTPALDDLLDRSAPRVDTAPETNRAAAALATVAVQRSRRRSRTSHIVATIAATVGVVSLTAGAAVALPLISDWWMWVPKNDLAIVTDPFEVNGETITCTIRVRALLDGASADEGSPERLQDARDFLRSVRPDDYADEAAALLVEWDDAPSPAEYNEAAALAGAISIAAQNRGLQGGGVVIDVYSKCPLL